jgi:hypothetical protein
MTNYWISSRRGTCWVYVNDKGGKQNEPSPVYSNVEGEPRMDCP